MGHLDFRDAPDKEAGTPERWLPVAAQIAAYAREFAGRGDIVANVGPGVGGPYGTACWNPVLCDLDVNADTCLPGIPPHRVNLKDEVFVLGALPFIGAITHEAAHARWSLWGAPMTLVQRGRDGHEAWDRAHIDVVVALEESRIEYLAVRHRRGIAPALTQMALSIVLRDFKVADTYYGASIGAALTLARRDAGLFSATEAKAFREALAILPDDILDGLRALWTRYHEMPTVDAAGEWPEGNFATMWLIADEWLDLVREAAKDGGEGGEGIPTGIPGEGGEAAFDPEGSEFRSDPTEGGGEDEDEGESDLDKAIRKAAGEVAMEREGDALDKRAEKVRERVIAERAADRERHEAGAKMAKKRDHGSHGYSEFAGSHRGPARAPEPSERAAANRLGGMLARITWHDRAVAKVDRVVPGGRLRPRAAVQKAADVARGGRAEIPMWRAKERKRTDDTPITVGIMTDISGSMGGAEVPSAVLTYVLSNAVAGIDGTVATATFGAEGNLVNRAHEKADVVQPWRAMDGTEAFKEAALLIDHELGILDGSGARVLVIFSDAYLVSGVDAAYARTFMGLCKSKGVAVVWANVGEDPSENFGYGASIRVGGDAAQIAEILGKAVVDEVRKVEAARAA